MTARSRRAANRSGTQCCDVCGKKRRLVVHHLSGHTGNQRFNLANVCPDCHQDIHDGIIVIEGWAASTLGLKLFWHRRDESTTLGRVEVPPG